MVNNSVVIPVSCLGAIVAISLVFVWWWFPRTWAKGNAEEADILARDGQRIGGREAQVANAEDILARFKARHAAMNDPNAAPGSSAVSTQASAMMPVGEKDEAQTNVMPQTQQAPEVKETV